MLVVDASAILEVLLQTPDAAAVQERLFRANESWHAPHLLDLEVIQVLRRYVLARTMSEARGRDALRVFAAMPITRYPHEPFRRRIWDLRANVTAYDAVYLALAEALPAPLVTADGRLAAVPGHAADVEVL